MLYFVFPYQMCHINCACMIWVVVQLLFIQVLTKHMFAGRVTTITKKKTKQRWKLFIVYVGSSGPILNDSCKVGVRLNDMFADL